MKKVYQVILGIAVLFIAFVVAGLGVEETRKREKNLKDLAKARQAKKDKHEIDLTDSKKDNNEESKIIEHTP